MAAELRHQRRCGAFAARLQHADQLVDHFPGREARVSGWVPVCGQLVGAQQAYLAALRGEDARLDHSGDAGVLGRGERLGDTVLALGEARLLEPRQRPAAVGIEVTLLLGQHFVEDLVDECQRLAHRQSFALGVEHAGVARVDRHAGADGRLRQVHRGDVAVLEVDERVGQLGLEGVEELAARGGGCVRSAWTADEDDAGGEGVGSMPRMRLPSSVRIGQVPLVRSRRGSPRRERSPSRCWRCLRSRSV